MASARDERGRLVDRVREVHFLTGRVIEEPAAAIANEVAYDEGYFDRITTEARLITADDDVAALGIRQKLAQSGATEKVIASATVVTTR